MRVTLLGAGRMGSFHARTLREHAAISQLVIFDVDFARAESLAHTLAARAVDCLEAALDSAGAAVIATPSPTHAALVHRCLDAGIPSFCEKPIAVGMAEMRRVVEHVAASGCILQVGFQRRFDAGYQAARLQIQDGSLGLVHSFSMVSRDALPPPMDYIATSGGIFRDLHIHDFDVMRWLFGQEVETVYATGSVVGFDEFREYDDSVTSALVVRLTDGTLGTLNGARHNPAGYDVRVDIFGSRDSIAIGLDQRTPLRSVEVGTPALSNPPYPDFTARFRDAYRAELDHFLRLARGEAENPCTASDAMEALRIAEAADRSWREARPVRLEEVG